MNPNYTDFRFPQIKAHPWHKVYTLFPFKLIEFFAKLSSYGEAPSVICMLEFFSKYMFILVCYVPLRCFFIKDLMMQTLT
jgi:hypothetical protein